MTPPETNYKVLIHSFGAYKRDSILPKWAIERAGKPDELVERGVLEETRLPVNVAVKVPETPTVAAAPPPGLVDELNALRQECQELRHETGSLRGENAALKAQLATRDKSLGTLTDERESWRKQAEEAEAKVEDLTKELEELTAPAV